MSISGNPHKLAMDIALGYTNVTMATLKRYNQQDLKTLNVNLNIVLRELRREQVPLEDIMAIKMKNMKIQRVNQALSIIRTYCRKKRIVV
jgi:hypothetical protein